MTVEREITQAVDPARGGRLNPEAVGSSREESTRSGIRPLHGPGFGDAPGDGTLHASAGVGSGRVGIEIDDDEGRTWAEQSRNRW